MLRRISILLASLMLLSLLVAGAALGREATGVDPAPAAQEVTLATAKANVELVQKGRAIVLARGNRMLVDSVPPLGGPNLEFNPMDMLLGALGSCGTFIYETAAKEMGIPLEAISTDVEADFAPAGLRDGAVNPRVRAFRIGIAVDGPTMEEAEMLAEQFRMRCPIYTTLELSAPLTITNRMMGEGTAVLEVDFTYDFASADEYIAAVSPMAEQWLAVPGLIWKTWILDEETKRAGAVYLFETPAARQAYLDSELGVAVATHPAFSDFRVQQYDVMRGESLVTRGPLEDESDEMDEAAVGDVGVVLEVAFTYNFETAAEYVAEVSPLADAFAAVPGLLWKVWTLNPETKRAGAVYYFESAEARQAYLDSELGAAVANHPALSEFDVTMFDVMADESIITRGPIGAP